METGISYSKYVTGKNFIGRKYESTILGNLLRQGENVVLYEPPRTGKTSLVQQTLMNLKGEGEQFITCEISLQNVRSEAGFLKLLGSAVLKAFGTTPQDFASMAEKYLAGTHLIFDQMEYSTNGSILSLNWDPDDNDLRSTVSLAQRIAADRGQSIFVLIDDFQNIMLTEDGERFCKVMAQTFREIAEADHRQASYILCGSQVNAMKEIFEHRKFFFRCAERVKINDIGEKDICDAMIRFFLSSGKVIEKDLMLGVCRLFKCNIWYINHFCNICDGMAKGYIMEPMLKEALSDLISIHEPRFKSTMNDLTTYQVSLLKAVIDGHDKFSSAEIIERYRFNSSANVRRLKDALCKKEIITFDEEDKPHILDPLFEYWVTTSYFGIS